MSQGNNGVISQFEIVAYLAYLAYQALVIPWRSHGSTASLWVFCPRISPRKDFSISAANAMMGDRAPLLMQKDPYSLFPTHLYRINISPS